MPTSRRRVGVAMALAVLALGVLPVSGWIPDGAIDPEYPRRWAEWGLGTSICVGAAILGAVFVGGMTEQQRGTVVALFHQFGRNLQSAPLLSDVLLAGLCLAAYLSVAQVVLSAKPLLIDEIVQVLQARMYAGGQLSVPVDVDRAFFSILHIVDTGSRAYSQFPPGWPAMLAIASLFRAEWVAGPVCGAIAVFVFARILRTVLGKTAPVTVAFGTLVFGLAPFCVAQFASHMSHGPVVMWLLIAILALSRVVRDGEPNLRTALVAGIAAGMAFSVRPLDAAAFLAPAAIWLLWRARVDSTQRLVAVLAATGLAIPLAGVLWVNLQTTGHATEFGYSALWGPAHGLGFHDSPWGDAHTPQRGLELLSLYLTRLNSHLLEAPFPALAPAILAVAFVRPFSAIERYLVSATAVHALLYFAYWHDGYYLGPRFAFPWVPLIVLLYVRLATAVTATRLSPRTHGAILGAAISAVALIAFVSVPIRFAQYRTGLVSMRADYADEARRAGITNALVFVHESWGAQLVARMWALGVSRPTASTLYDKVDACALELAITQLEGGVSRGGRAAEAALRPLLTDSTRVLPSSVSPDTTERMLPGFVYDARCTAQVAADRDGYALMPPFLLDRESGNVYARDLGELNRILAHRLGRRRAVIVSRDGVDGDAPLLWTPVEFDSARQE